MKKGTWKWIAIAVGGLLLFRHFSNKKKEVLEIENGKVTVNVPPVRF